jgi:hypothetical protein
MKATAPRSKGFAAFKEKKNATDSLDVSVLPQVRLSNPASISGIRGIFTEMSFPEYKQKSDAAYPGKANHIAWLDKNVSRGHPMSPKVRLNKSVAAGSGRRLPERHSSYPTMEPGARRFLLSVCAGFCENLSGKKFIAEIPL